MELSEVQGIHDVTSFAVFFRENVSPMYGVKFNFFQISMSSTNSCNCKNSYKYEGMYFSRNQICNNTFKIMK